MIVFSFKVIIRKICHEFGSGLPKFKIKIVDPQVIMSFILVQILELMENSKVICVSLPYKLLDRGWFEAAPFSLPGSNRRKLLGIVESF